MLSPLSGSLCLHVIQSPHKIFNWIRKLENKTTSNCKQKFNLKLIIKIKILKQMLINNLQMCFEFQNVAPLPAWKYYAVFVNVSLNFSAINTIKVILNFKNGFDIIDHQRTNIAFCHHKLCPLCKTETKWKIKTNISNIHFKYSSPV